MNKNLRLTAVAVGFALSLFGWLFSSEAEAGACYGLRPLPPPRCGVVCMCDRFGQNCRWEIVC